MDTYQVVSLSGGKDSTAMLLMMLERGEHIDEIVVCDTGMEFPEMYQHLEKLEEQVGMSFTRLKASYSFEYLMFDYKRKRGKFQGKCGYGWPRPNARWCTSKLKTDVINRYFRELSKHKNVIHCVGIAFDESQRAKDKRYPLIEYGVTEDQALKYCYSKGFDWEGLYEIFNRVSCWCCPLQPIAELRKLRKFRPDLWKKLCDMDKKSWNSFRIDYDTQQLEKRFAIEDRQLSLFGGEQPCQN